MGRDPLRHADQPLPAGAALARADTVVGDLDVKTRGAPAEMDPHVGDVTRVL
jgi:hypothetical protein